MSSRLCSFFRNIYYFFLPLAGAFFFAAGLDAVVFFAAAGFFAFEADGAADFFPLGDEVAASLGADLLAMAVFIIALGRGSVLSPVADGMGAAAGAEAGAAICCLAASCQFGKNNSMRWREMELARRQRGQCAS